MYIRNIDKTEKERDRQTEIERDREIQRERAERVREDRKEETRRERRKIKKGHISVMTLILRLKSRQLKLLVLVSLCIPSLLNYYLI